MAKKSANVAPEERAGWRLVEHKAESPLQSDRVADYLVLPCPICGEDNTLACVVDGEVQMAFTGADGKLPCQACGVETNFAPIVARELAAYAAPRKAAQVVEAVEELPVAPEVVEFEVIDVPSLDAAPTDIYGGA